MDSAAVPQPKKLSTYTPQSDPSQYIRTFARDMAMLNKSGDVSAEEQPIPQIDSKREATAMGVSLPDFDPSPINNSDGGVSPKEFKQEAVELSSSDSEGIFTNTTPSTPTPAPMPLMPQAAVGVTQSVVHSSPIPEAPVSPQVPSREDILTRLRAKASVAPAPIENRPEAPASIVDIPLRTGAPDFSVPDLSWIPKPPEPVVEAVSVPIPAPQPLPTRSTSPLHTYSSDFSERIDSQKSSTFSVLAAQSDAGQTPVSVPKKRRNLVPLFAGIAMLVVGAGAIYVASVFFQTKNAVPNVAVIPSLVTFDEAVQVQGSGSELLQAVSDVAQGTTVTGNVVVTYVTNVSDTGISNIPQPGAVLIKRLGLPAPDILLRNIQDTSTVGIIRAGSESRPFMVLKVNSYERTFAGMLSWERTLSNDLNIWFPDYGSLPSQGSTASTTPVVVLQSTPGFTDVVVANYDVRILRDASGRSLMIYGYHGKDTLIIARDEAAFTALISRLSSSGE